MTRFKRNYRSVEVQGVTVHTLSLPATVPAAAVPPLLSCLGPARALHSYTVDSEYTSVDISPARYGEVARTVHLLTCTLLRALRYQGTGYLRSQQTGRQFYSAIAVCKVNSLRKSQLQTAFTLQELLSGLMLGEECQITLGRS